MGAVELLAQASASPDEESVAVGGGSIVVRRADPRDVINATKYAGQGDEDQYRLAIAALSIVDDSGRPFVDPGGSLDRGIEALSALPGGLQIAICGAAMRVNGFTAGN